MEQPQEHDRAVDDRNPPPGSRGRRRPAWGRVLRALGIFVCGLALGAAALHFGVKRPALDTARVRAQQYEHDLAVVRGRLDEAMNAMAAIEGRLAIEESTRRGLETSLRTAQAELGRAHDSIAFYEQLMPPGPNGAVSVRALDIERAGPNLRYRVLLMRSGSNGKLFKGSLQFVATGSQNGEEVSVTLKPATLPGARGAVPEQAADADSDGADSGAEAFELSFGEFQRSGGLLSLPEGFVPESVTVNVLEGKVLRVSRSVEIPKPG